jgi:hypothetical protein
LDLEPHPVGILKGNDVSGRVVGLVLEEPVGISEEWPNPRNLEVCCWIGETDLV